jgi:mannosidase alpha-like ER degradation enhancer 2
MKKYITNLLCLTLLICFYCNNNQKTSSETKVTAEMVKAEFLHAWNGYKQYAWGHDALKPLSNTYHDWYGESLLMTPVDAFDTMILMGLTKEAAEAKQLIMEKLSFDKDFKVQSFEITIRLLGGLLSCYQLDGDERFLRLAEDLGTRLLPIFDSPTGMPYRYVHFQTGETSDHLNNPAEIGTTILEFGTLSMLTNNPVYYDKAKNAIVQLYERRSKIGLVGTVINVETGEWVNKTSHIGGMIDSYYEYLLKAWLLFGDEDFKMMWENSIKAINSYLADSTDSGFWYGLADMNTGELTLTHFGALQAFFPAVLALGGDLKRAEDLQASWYKMWNLHGIEPEVIDFETMDVIYKSYVLRPEIIESAYYLYHYTKNPKYRKMGETFFHDLVKYCKVEDGYAALENVITKEQGDAMESFFLAETLKYLYLLFAPDETLNFDKVIFNTEAHPIKKMHN